MEDTISSDSYFFSTVFNTQGVINKGCFQKSSLKEKKIRKKDEGTNEKYFFGDAKGTLTGISIKKWSQLEVLFRANGSKGDSSTNKVTSVFVNDKSCLFSCGASVTSVNKKNGKINNTFDSNLEICGVSADKSNVVFFNDFFLSRHKLSSESGQNEQKSSSGGDTFLSQEKIQSILVHNNRVFFSCGDKSVKTISLDSKKDNFDTIEQSISCKTLVNTFSIHTEPNENKFNTSIQSISKSNDNSNGVILHGGVDGQIGMIYVDELNSSKIRPYKSEPIFNSKRNQSINSIMTFDFSQSGQKNIVFGTSSGDLVVLRPFLTPKLTNILLKREESNSENENETFDEEKNEEEKVLIRKGMKESITNIAGHSHSLILSSNSGRLCFFLDKRQPLPAQTESIGKGEGEHNSKSSNNSTINAEKEKLLLEIAEKEKKLGELRKSYQELSKEMVATEKKAYDLKVDMVLVGNVQVLNVEMNIGIDVVVLAAKMPLNIVKHSLSFELTSNIRFDSSECDFLLSSISDNESNAPSVNKCEITLRTLESKTGDLDVYVVPKTTPKIAFHVAKTIKPLSLHERVDFFNDKEDQLLSEMKITGEFSLQQIHNWMYQCLNDVPEKLLDKDQMTLFFRSSFLNTSLRVAYKEREANITSNSISTISIIEEFITKCATSQKIPIKVSFKMNFDSVKTILKKVFPDLNKELTLKENFNILESLKELSAQDKESMVNEEFKKILTDESTIRENYKNHKVNMQFIYDVLVRLLFDKCKFKRVNPKEKITQLKEILKAQHSISEEDLFSIFKF